MGSGIAEVCAKAGLSVAVTELDEEALKRGRQRVEDSLRRAVKAGKVSEDDALGFLGNIAFSTDHGVLEDASW
jgi:3-hydroxybutyryl-CoA dehydrogenase